jgi:hypothetical protein
MLATTPLTDGTWIACAVKRMIGFVAFLAVAAAAVLPAQAQDREPRIWSGQDVPRDHALPSAPKR